MQAPKLIQDLGRDLRDKRLLPVVGLLVVAIIAVPFLLGGGSDPIPPPTGVSSADVNQGSAADAQAEPVVLAEVPGIREYKKRLANFQKRNPFKQQFTDSGGSAESSLNDTSSSDSLSGGGSSSSLDSSSSASNSNSGGSSSGGGEVAEPELILHSWEIDAKVTVEGKTEKVEGVKQLDFIPGRKTPVLQFIQGDFGESSAAFVVSPKVTDTRGKGECSPNNRNCEFLFLKDGKAHSFDYEPNGLTYKIELTKVTLIEERVDPEEFSSEELRKRSSASGDLLSAGRG